MVDKSRNFNFDKNEESNLKEIIKDILNKLKSSELTIMLSYHSYLGKSILYLYLIIVFCHEV